MSKRKKMYDPEAEERKEQEAYRLLQEAIDARFIDEASSVTVDGGAVTLYMNICNTCGCWVPTSHRVDHHQWHAEHGE